MEGSSIISLRENTCNLDSNTKDLYICFPSNSLDDKLTNNLIAKNYESQFPSQFTTDEDKDGISFVLTGLMHNYTTYLVANEHIKM